MARKYQVSSRVLSEKQVTSALHESLQGRPFGGVGLFEVSWLIGGFSKRLGYSSDADHFAFAKRVVATPYDDD